VASAVSTGVTCSNRGLKQIWTEFHGKRFCTL
jgi:hypothetical protein